MLLAGKYWQVNIRRAHSTTVTALLRLHQNDFIKTVRAASGSLGTYGWNVMSAPPHSKTLALGHTKSLILPFILPLIARGLPVNNFGD